MNASVTVQRHVLQIGPFVHRKEKMRKNRAVSFVALLVLCRLFNVQTSFLIVPSVPPNLAIVWTCDYAWPVFVTCCYCVQV